MIQPQVEKIDTIDHQSLDNSSTASVLSQHNPNNGDPRSPDERSYGTVDIEEKTTQVSRRRMRDAKTLLDANNTELSNISSELNHPGENYQKIDSSRILSNGRDRGENQLVDNDGENGADDEMMDKISSSPSIEDEEIDFEFVYALHTFIATIEGQANATKGDTMVLLDDSNSYWWLVRVVKDSTIGYLPAEHIETPTERLARLNKHRNIDLTSTMLSDQSEKPKNSLKIAFRKRGTKSVTFTDPTYVEASDVDYSSEDEDERQEYLGLLQAHDLTYVDQENLDNTVEADSVEPLRTRSEVRLVGADVGEQDNGVVTSDSASGRASDDPLNGTPDNKSRNGILRNTDSFFQDDSVETRKITLTPNLLRDDSSPSTIRGSNDSKELSRASLEKLEKDSPERGKEKKERREKKEKDKKTGMLSGLFKRKDRRMKSTEEDIDDILGIKQSNEFTRNSPVLSKGSDEISTVEEPTTMKSPEQKQPIQPEKQGNSTSPSSQVSQVSNQAGDSPKIEREPGISSSSPSTTTPSLRLVKSDEHTEPSSREEHVSPSQSSLNSREDCNGNVHKNKAFRSESSLSGKKESKLNAATHDDIDSSLKSPAHVSKSPEELSQHTVSKETVENSGQDGSMLGKEGLSESPVQVSYTDESQSYPPALVVDSESQDGPPSSASSALSEVLYAEESQTKIVTASSTMSVTATRWNDTQLRSFFDDSADIKDLLIVVYDKTGVVPASSEHPIVGTLFKEENARLADMENRLDCLLGDLLARKVRNHSDR